MSSRPLTTGATPTLAEAVDETLGAALAGHVTRCLWCGGPDLAVRTADPWTGAVVVCCRRCGSELVGVVPRQLREVA